MGECVQSNHAAKLRNDFHFFPELSSWQAYVQTSYRPFDFVIEIVFLLAD